MSVLGASVLDQPLVFVDIETNGLDHIRGRVIEVAAIRVENGKVMRQFSSLVDPETELPYFITNLTGITTNDVRQAPAFHQIADELEALFDGATFVAHNVRFDYSFLKQEFKRLGRPFLPKQLCTVKLSRALYPHERSHKLANLIERHSFTYSRRHRAYDDAAVLWQFIRHIRQNFPPEQIEAAVSRQLKQPALPRHLQPELVRSLPEAPGVYIFEDEAGQPLYVGKSINIKQRVMSHFGRDHAASREFKIAQTVKHIRTEQTPGELSALLLESRLVKELQPVYNRQLRCLSELLLVKQAFTEQGYASLALETSATIDPDEAAAILAVYPQRSRAKAALREMLKSFDLCPKLMGLEKSEGACFHYQLHKCRGACIGRESSGLYNQRVLAAFERTRLQRWPFKGPILLEEITAGATTQALIVDKWCILGEIKQEPFCEPVVSTAAPAGFDLDTYKILQSHLAHKLHQLTIRQLLPEQLAQLEV
jgi:DNA polymerase-3 subunit epsilon